MVVVLLGSLALQGCAVAALTADGFAGGTEIKHTVSFALLGLAQLATFVMSLIRWFSTAHDTFWFVLKELVWASRPVANFAYVWDWWMPAVFFVLAPRESTATRKRQERCVWMARKMTDWPSNRRPLTTIRPSDGCKWDGVPLAVDQWYDFPEFGCHLGNVG